jgi:amylosucrase
MDWDRAARALADPDSLPGRIWHGLRAILARRAEMPQFHGDRPIEVLEIDDRSVFAFARRAPTGDVLCLYNFSEDWTTVSRDWAGRHGVTAGREALSGGTLDPARTDIALPPYARAWFV